ncbi:hypothetical protein QQP08_018428, partial [Theobroma cacao]
MVEVCGFGYDSKNDDYKVVRVVRWHDYLEGQGYRQAEVYTLGMNSWRKVGSPDMNVDHWIHQAYLNGAIHWLGHQNKRSCGVRFDVSSEQLDHLMAIPSKISMLDISGASQDCIYTKAARVQKIIPESTLSRPESGRLHHVTLGLGYDSVNNDYKVVRVASSESHKEGKLVSITQAEVHTLGMNSWREVAISPGVNFK